MSEHGGRTDPEAPRPEAQHPDGLHHDALHHDDGVLLDELRALWDTVDPAPADLAERVLFAVQLEDLDTEFELLRMTDRSDALAGTRAAAHQRSDATHITFAGAELTVMLAVSVDAAGEETRRLDGWVAPAGAVRVVLHTIGGHREATSDGSGRFVLEAVSAGMVQLLVHRAEGPPFVTPTVEI